MVDGYQRSLAWHYVTFTLLQCSNTLVLASIASQVIPGQWNRIHHIICTPLLAHSYSGLLAKGKCYSSLLAGNR